MKKSGQKFAIPGKLPVSFQALVAASIQANMAVAFQALVAALIQAFVAFAM